MQQGTPQSATNFNHMENGIHDAHVAEAIFMQAKMYFSALITAAARLH